MSCYITQEDLLVPYLSLDEVMLFASSLKLPSSYSLKQKKSVVEDVQEMFGLTECKNTRTEALSGGQKKRLSIALELINNPPILFLDEPTSGLDNVAASNLIKLLSCLAHQGRTIVCTIHQPSASMFTLFDNAYVMASGLCIYQGATQEIVPFLESAANLVCPEHYNPADYVIEVAEVKENINILSKAIDNGRMTNCGRLPAKVDLGNLNLTSDIPLTNLSTAQNGDNKSPFVTNVFSYGRIQDDDDLKKMNCSDFSVSYWTQFCTLLLRMFLQMRRNKAAINLLIFHHIGSSIMGGIMFYQKANDATQGFSHLKLGIGIIIFHTFTYCMIPILSYPFEVKLVKKEHFNQWYSLGPYFTAATLSTIPTVFILSFVFSFLLYWMCGFPNETYRFFIFYLVGVIVSFISEAMGKTIGSVFSVTNGAAVGPLSLTPIFGLAIYGFDFVRSIPIYMVPLLKTSFMRSGVIVLIISMFGMDRKKMDCPDPFCLFTEPKVVMFFLDLDGQSPWHETSALLIMLLVFKMLQYFALKWRLST